MNIKIYAFLTLFLCLTVGLFAQSRSQSEALQTATAFYGSGAGSNNKTAMRTASTSTLELAYVGGNVGSPDYYVYNIGKGNGFIIVAGDARMKDDVFMYSQSGCFDVTQIPEPFQAYLDAYSEAIALVRKQPLSSIQTLSGRSAKARSLAEVSTVGPLLGDIAWDQEAPYNNACPLSGGARSLTGCGATSTSQVMRFFKWPAQGQEEYKGINFGTTTYNWNLMLPTYKFNALGTDEEKAEVAKLMFHVGTSINMIYSVAGSGTDIRQIPSALSTYFKYNPNMQVAYRLAYTNAEWIALLKREIDLGHPLVYAGVSKAGAAHLFVCDGYDSSNKFHFNFGWDGRWNGWATVDFVGVSGEVGYLDSNAVILGFRPNNVPATDEEEAAPQVVLLSPLNCSSYSPNLGEAFNVGMRVSNLSTKPYNNLIGVALYKGATLVGNILKSEIKVLKESAPAPSSLANEVDLLYKGLIIPSGTANGTYQLRVVSKIGNLWVPAQGFAADIVKEITVTVKDGATTFSYAQGKTVKLELVSPIEINVANNRTLARFSIKNTDALFDCIDADVAIMVCPNDALVPTVWKRLTIESLQAGLVQDFEIKDIPLPVDASIKSCRIYLAYNQVKNKPYIDASNPSMDRTRSFTPIFPEANNFVSYTVPQEGITSLINFKTTAIPATYKKYLDKGVADDGKLAWGPGILSNAMSKNVNVRLVTDAILVKDENAVLEWQMDDMYGSAIPYRLYISTEGQNYDYFKTPVYDYSFLGKTIVRLSLADYAGKNIYLAIEDPKGNNALMYIKVLDIKAPKDISVQKVTIPSTVLVGQTIPIKVSVKNHSAVNVRKINATYTINGTKVDEVLTTNIAFDQTEELTFSTPLLITGKPGDAVDIKVHVALDNEASSALKNNDGVAKYTVMNFFPKKNLLIYKVSKSGCQACKSTYTAIDEVEELFPSEATGVEIWRDGNFRSEDFMSLSGGTTPTFYVNGQWTPDFAVTTLLTRVKSLYPTFAPPADVFTTADYESPTSRKLKIKVRAKFAMPVVGNYRMGAFIIENNVKNIDGEISGTHPTGEELTKNHIPVGTIGGCHGSADWTITNPTSDGDYVFESTFTVPDELAYKYRRDNIQVIGVLFSPDGTPLNTSLNSHYVKLHRTEGLTFVPEFGYPAFKDINEVKSTGFDVFVSEKTSRATVLTGSDFKFKIQKDDTWKGKELRLVVKTSPKVDTRKEEVLFPDAKGVYTIENAQKNYLITIQSVEPNSAQLTKNGSQVALTGTWTVADFDKLDLSDVRLTGADLTAIEIPANVPSLNFGNPNAFVYISADATSVSSAWKNVVKGEEAEAIELQDGFPFFNSKVFTPNSISFKRTFAAAGWESFCLPFEMYSIPNGTVVEMFIESAESLLKFETVSMIKANTPYIIKVASAGEKTFTGFSLPLPITNLLPVSKGEFAFEGTFAKLSGTSTEGLYLLAADGENFSLALASSEIDPFRTFIRYNGSTAIANNLKVYHNQEIPTGEIGEATAGELTVVVRNGVLEFTAPHAMTLRIHRVNGDLIQIIHLEKGVRTLTGLPKGVYLINNKKAVL